MLIQRDIQQVLHPWLERCEILFILGARQVGKTSLLRLLQRDLTRATLNRIQVGNTEVLFLPLWMA